MTALIHQFAIGSDNFGVLIHDPSTGATASIDAGEEAPIAAALQHKGWTLTDILITHHHGDHIAGLAGLKARYAARVVGAATDSYRIAGLDVEVREGDAVKVGALTFNVIETPGHTVGHVVYYSSDEAIVFTGDTLFSLGCGRLFEETPEKMWTSLQKLAALPDDTRVYCGHEYTLSNGRFAVKIEPDNVALMRRVAEVEALRGRGAFTLPSTIGLEKATNPFLRASEPALAVPFGLQGHSAVEVFAALRSAKDKA